MGGLFFQPRGFGAGDLRSLCCDRMPRKLVATLWTRNAAHPCECLLVDGEQFIEPLVFCLEWQDDECVDEKQRLSIGGGTPTSGTFRLSFLGSQTTDLAWNATASEVKDALEATAHLLVGDISTDGGPLPETPITITFVGDRACEDVAKLIIANNALDAGTPQITVIVNGGSSWKICGGDPNGADWSDLCCSRRFCLRLICGEHDVPADCGSFLLASGCHDPNDANTHCNNAVYDVLDVVPNCCTGCPGCDDCCRGPILQFCPSNHPALLCNCTEPGGPDNFWCIQVEPENNSGAWDADCTCLRYGGVDEEQRIAADGPVTGGTFTLTLLNETTAPIPWNATPVQVCSALRSLQVVRNDNCVSCISAGRLPTNAIVVKFTCCLGGRNIPLLGVDDSEITGGGGLVVTTDVQGVHPARYNCAGETFPDCGPFECEDIGRPEGVANCCCPCLPNTLFAEFRKDPECIEWTATSLTLTHTIIDGQHCWQGKDGNGDGYRLCCASSGWIGSFLCNHFPSAGQLLVIRCDPFFGDGLCNRRFLFAVLVRDSLSMLKLRNDKQI